MEILDIALINIPIILKYHQNFLNIDIISLEGRLHFLGQSCLCIFCERVLLLWFIRFPSNTCHDKQLFVMYSDEFSWGNTIEMNEQSAGSLSHKKTYINSSYSESILIQKVLKV